MFICRCTGVEFGDTGCRSVPRGEGHRDGDISASLPSYKRRGYQPGCLYLSISEPTLVFRLIVAGREIVVHFIAIS